MRWAGIVTVVAACAAAPRGSVVDEVQRELAGAGASRYAFGEEGQGGAIDCSGYVNRVLAHAAPRAYAEVVALRHRPRSREYVEIAERGGEGWLRVAHVAELRPGDVIAWRHRPNTPTKDPRSTGHVGIVVAAPRRAGAGLWEVRISDAAKSGHSDDTRPRGVSGIGAGVILVAVDAEDAPTAVAWSLRGRFEVPEAIALGRPR